MALINHMTEELLKQPDIKLKMVAGKVVDADTEFVSVPKFVVDLADKLSALVKIVSPNGKVETENDWNVVVALWEAYIICYPAEFQIFYDDIHKVRNMHESTRGFTKDKEMMAQMKIPEKFDKMLKLYYPLQVYDKSFSRRLMREIPILAAV